MYGQKMTIRISVQEKASQITILRNLRGLICGYVLYAQNIARSDIVCMYQRCISFFIIPIRHRSILKDQFPIVFALYSSVSSFISVNPLLV